MPPCVDMLNYGLHLATSVSKAALCKWHCRAHLGAVSHVIRMLGTVYDGGYIFLCQSRARSPYFYIMVLLCSVRCMTMCVILYGNDTLVPALALARVRISLRSDKAFGAVGSSRQALSCRWRRVPVPGVTLAGNSGCLS